jgi:IS5 family transposase
MLVEKYASDNILERIPGLTMAMSPELAAIDRVLDDDELFCLVRNDLAQRHAQTACAGRHSTPVEVILRMLAVRYLYNWGFRETEHHVSDSLVLRQFCRVYLQAVPDHTTLCKWAQQLQDETLQAFNARLMEMAVADKLTRGRKLRTDGMVVETNIHHPTDSSLLADGVRVLGRTLGRARQLLGEASDLPKCLFRNRTRSAKNAARQIAKTSRRQAERFQTVYQRLLATTQATLDQVAQVAQALHTEASDCAQQLLTTFQTFVPRVQQVVKQTTRRIMDDESVPAADKLVSIFEPHSDIIRRGKTNKPTEFGHKVWLGEVEGGFISHYRILDGNPADEQQWQPTLTHHQQQFSHPPWQASADRGVYSADNEQFAHDLGVQRIILPHKGHKSVARRQHEHQPCFRRGRRYHAGIEGRISVISRKYGLNRCRDRGSPGFARWVGWAVIANNLTSMARAYNR